MSGSASPECGVRGSVSSRCAGMCRQDALSGGNVASGGKVASGSM